MLAPLLFFPVSGFLGRIPFPAKRNEEGLVFLSLFLRRRKDRGVPIIIAKKKQKKKKTKFFHARENIVIGFVMNLS